MFLLFLFELIILFKAMSLHLSFLSNEHSILFSFALNGFRIRFQIICLFSLWFAVVLPISKNKIVNVVVYTLKRCCYYRRLYFLCVLNFVDCFLPQSVPALTDFIYIYLYFNTLCHFYQNCLFFFSFLLKVFASFFINFMNHFECVRDKKNCSDRRSWTKTKFRVKMRSLFTIE